MRGIDELSEKILTLIELLGEMGGLEISAEITPVQSFSGSDSPRLAIRLSGRDTEILTANNGQVLDAIEVLASDMLGLTDAERERLQFDAGTFLADQRSRLRHVARTAVSQVKFTGAPHVFPPMNLRDRRLLEHALQPSGLHFESLGQQTTRWLILYPQEFAARPESSEPQHSRSN